MSTGRFFSGRMAETSTLDGCARTLGCISASLLLVFGFLFLFLTCKLLSNRAQGKQRGK